MTSHIEEADRFLAMAQSVTPGNTKNYGEVKGVLLAEAQVHATLHLSESIFWLQERMDVHGFSIEANTRPERRYGGGH